MLKTNVESQDHKSELYNPKGALTKRMFTWDNLDQKRKFNFFYFCWKTEIKLSDGLQKTLKRCTLEN